MARPPTRPALAAEAWRLLFDFLLATSAHRQQALARHGLTPNDSRALFALDPHEGRTMSALAEAWRCDASNATWVVDRLEKLGLAERHAHPTDRRARLVRLTDKGAQTKAALAEELYQPPPELLALDRDALQQLVTAARSLRKPGGDAG